MSEKLLNPVSRRGFLTKSAAVLGGAGAAVLGFQSLFDVNPANAQANDDDPSTIFNLAATLETLACTHYYMALTAFKIQFTPAQAAYIKAALDAEQQHLDFLNANGGQTLVQKFFVPTNVFSDASVFAAYTEIAENAFVAAYLAATRRFAQLNKPELAATMAQIVAVEAQHLALARQFGGKLPNNVSIAEAKYFKVNQVVDTITAFMQGANGFDKDAVPYPGAVAIKQLIAGDGVTSVKPFTDTTQFQNLPTAQATQAATSAAVLNATSAATAAQ